MYWKTETEMRLAVKGYNFGEKWNNFVLTSRVFVLTDRVGKFVCFLKQDEGNENKLKQMSTSCINDHLCSGSIHWIRLDELMR
jgi:hypothetical protein